MSKQSRARAAARADRTRYPNALSTDTASAASCISPAPEPNIHLAHRGILLASGIIVLAALATYHNSFSGPFIADDLLAITDNPTIRHWENVLSPPSHSPTGGRPLLNLTFALNYALGGMNVWGYHAINLLIHALAGLTLFGIVRWTLLRPALAGLRRAGPAASNQEPSFAEATPLALAVAVIWIVHPLQTEAVTFISQRAESLMGLFYLLTLYGFIRGVESGVPARWQTLSIAACFLGALSKEIIVTVPVMVLLYDRTFIAGSFREAWRLRWRYYIGLASIWLLLAYLMIDLNQRAVGFGEGVMWWNYALTSCRSVVWYLKLAIWPHPLVFDYGTDAIVVQHVAEILPYALVLAVLLVGTAIAFWRRLAIGFAGAWFFVILAPTSSVVPVVLQPMAEHRMYLSLAAIIALVVLGLYAVAGRRGLIVIVAAVVALGCLSIRRNDDYRSALAIWTDTVEKCPDNERAQNNLGILLVDIPSHLFEAICHYEMALRSNPGYALTHSNLGVALSRINRRLPDAIAECQMALRIEPDLAEAHNNLANVLLMIPGRLPDAIAECQTALRLKPDLAEAHYNLATALSQSKGRLPDAIVEFEVALRLKPDYVEAHNGLGMALATIPGRLPEAISHYEATLRLKPDFAEAHYNLGMALATIPGRLPEAISHDEAAFRLKPDYAEAHNNLGMALAKIPDRLPEAILEFEAAIRINPRLLEAHYNLGNALLDQGRYRFACEQYEEALKLDTKDAAVHVNLGVALLRMGWIDDAVGHFETALQIKPDYPFAQKDLAIARDILFKSHGKNLSEHPVP